MRLLTETVQWESARDSVMSLLTKIVQCAGLKGKEENGSTIWKGYSHYGKELFNA